MQTSLNAKTVNRGLAIILVVWLCSIGAFVMAQEIPAPPTAKTVEQQLAEAKAQIADQSKQLQFYAQENAGCEARLARAVAAIPQQPQKAK